MTSFLKNPLDTPVAVTDTFIGLRKAGDVVEVLYSWDACIPAGVYKLVLDERKDCSLDRDKAYFHCYPHMCPIPLEKGLLSRMSGPIRGRFLVVEDLTGSNVNLCKCIVAGVTSVYALYSCAYAGYINIALDKFIFDENKLVVGVVK